MRKTPFQFNPLVYLQKYSTEYFRTKLHIKHSLFSLMNTYDVDRTRFPANQRTHRVLQDIDGKTC